MRTVILSGVSSGLGKAFFDLLLTTSAKIIAIGRTFPAEIISGENLTYINRDLAKVDLDFSLITSLVSPDTQEIIFINNAGIIEPLKHIGTFTDNEIISSVSVNLIAPILLTNTLVALCQNKSIKLRILNITTGAAVKSIDDWSLYCSTKAAAKMFYNCLQQENDSVEIKQVDPGVMDTKMQDAIRAVRDKKIVQSDKRFTIHQKGDLPLPKDIAHRILMAEDLL